MNSILAIDTSSPVLSVAFKKGKGEILRKNISGFLKHAENLLPAIDQLLKKKKTSIKEVKTFLIGRGPGSFTGLRIGFATLKGFLALEKKNCFGATSLDMIAENIELPEKTELAVLLDARRDKVYARFYKRRNGNWIPKGKPETLPLIDLISKLPKEIFIAGDALARYQDMLIYQSEQSGKKIHFIPENKWYPNASTLIHWFENRDKKLVRLEKPRDFIPLYFRLSEAEERKKAYANTC